MKKLTLALIGTCVILNGCNNPEKSTSEATEPAKVANGQPANHQHNAEVINYEGFGPAKFGGNEESVRMSWGRPLNASKPAVGATCYYLYLDPKPANHQEIAFMLEEGKFVRYDIDDAKWVAPGNIVVGDSTEAILQAHPHADKQPHKYIEGAYTLTVTPSEFPHSRLIFETDTSGKVTHWRIGVEPQIYYVEGCS